MDKMRIAYVLSSDIARYLGSTQKVKQQIEAWQEFGYQVEAFCLTPDANPSILKCKRFVKKHSSLLDKLFINYEFIKALDKFNPDLVYIRYSLPNASFSMIQKKYINAIEINTDDFIEYLRLYRTRGGMKHFFLFLLNAVLRRSFLRRANGLVTVTEEIKRNRRFSRFNKNITAIPNAVIFPDVRLKELHQFPDNGKLKLFFIGAPGIDWQGVDKLHTLAKRLQDHIELHIVGEERQRDLKECKNITWHGYLPEEKYLPILSSCHVCIGTMALHRKEMTEACTLKVREYLRHGYPTIIGYRDTAFIEEKPEWLLELPNRQDVFESEANINAVLEFCTNYRDYVVPKEEVLPYIGIECIEQKRIKTFEKIVHGN